MKIKSALIIIVVIIVGGVAWYGLSPLLNNIEVQDEMPQVTSDTVTNESQNNNTDAAERIRGPFPVVETPLHEASGSLRVFETDTGTILRYEDFSTINGPELHVYLATDLDATNYIDLGPIKGTSGNINYDVPPNIDLSKYKYVLTWCVPFGVLFNSVEIL